mmetsp:Transcript_9044/g.16332  ORF Transcript_9044/g.16332 Transcript_9044/m.16332 type:complete len:92 (+) Transcript_9044:190-465(+)
MINMRSSSSWICGKNRDQHDCVVLFSLQHKMESCNEVQPPQCEPPSLKTKVNPDETDGAGVVMNDFYRSHSDRTAVVLLSAKMNVNRQCDG